MVGEMFFPFVAVVTIVTLVTVVSVVSLVSFVSLVSLVADIAGESKGCDCFIPPGRDKSGPYAARHRFARRSWAIRQKYLERLYQLYHL